VPWLRVWEFLLHLRQSRPAFCKDAFACMRVTCDMRRCMQAERQRLAAIPGMVHPHEDREENMGG
jgi:hypothetical protein